MPGSAAQGPASCLFQVRGNKQIVRVLADECRGSKWKKREKKVLETANNVPVAFLSFLSRTGQRSTVNGFLYMIGTVAVTV